ncbi:hypothetical protein EVAR_84023_1 [Eumeta japonica]|uniref:Uncharacterized protein n=1 Tax=Eumeta variegata TaxID=151549 RepID=A0A4C1X518_EUMVA|nr:hypothetical protein EVAR_84023_1 [Eumeta japonica]
MRTPARAAHASASIIQMLTADVSRSRAYRFLLPVIRFAFSAGVKHHGSNVNALVHVVRSVDRSDTGYRSKYQQLDDGALYISAVRPDDRFTTFRCRVHDRLEDREYTSQRFGHVIVTEPKGSVRPRASVDGRARRVPLGRDLRLPCAAHAWPVPTYRRNVSFTRTFLIYTLEQKAVIARMFACPAGGWAVKAFRHGSERLGG